MAQICFTGLALLPKTDKFVLPVPLQLVQSKWRYPRLDSRSEENLSQTFAVKSLYDFQFLIVPLGFVPTTTH